MAKPREVEYHTLVFICSLANILRPREHLTVGQWANKHMVLPEGSNESGHFSTSSMPYQQDILDAIADPYVVDVSIMASAQVGKTTIILCGIGYYIEHEPSTQLMVLPTLKLGEDFSKIRLAPMISEVAVLRDKVAPPRTKDSDNTMLFKSYPGGHIVIAGANSAPSLSSLPLRVIWMDETDRFPESTGQEGNPIKLAQKRAKSYWNKKFIKTSTPTIAGKSKIEDAYKKGSMEEWCVQCPSCGEWQPYAFKRIVFASQSMICSGCGEIIPEQDWKNSQHKWIAKHPERRRRRSFHLNELYSPLTTWQEIIEEFQDAMDRLERFHDPEDLKVFINTTLGECWDETKLGKKQMKESELQKRAEYYPADIPNRVLLLTAAVDVQDDRFEIEVRGWTRNYETWGLFKTEIYGETETSSDLEKNGIWKKLEKYLRTTFSFSDGRELNIAATGIDTGGSHTSRTYKWVKEMNRKGKKVYGLKGYPGNDNGPLLYSRSTGNIREEDKNGKEFVVGKVTLYIVNVDSGKKDIMNRLTIEDPGEGYCHFPSNDGRGYDADYYKGLLSEHQIEKKVRGVVRKVWVKKAGIVRNEPLDLFNYNYAVLELLRPIWDELEAQLEKGINYMKGTRKNKKRRKPQKGLEV